MALKKRSGVGCCVVVDAISLLSREPQQFKLISVPLPLLGDFRAIGG
jgi:hypothetical protein